MLVFGTTPRPLHVYLFIALNVLDILLTAAALSLGARELNGIFAWARHPIVMAAVKMILVGAILLGLVMWRRTYLIHLLNTGMTLVVIWNIAAVISWS